MVNNVPSILILGVDEEASILADFLRSKDIPVYVCFSQKELKKINPEKRFDICVLDEKFEYKKGLSIDETIESIRNDLNIKKIYCMSYITDPDPVMPLYEDGHIYKPLTEKDLNIFYRVVLTDEKKELVCIFFGLRFYASPERAAILKTRIEDYLLKNFESEGLVGVDVHLPPVDLTPTISKLLDPKKRNK